MGTSPQGYQRQIHSPSELGSAISELRSNRRKTQFEVASALAIDRSQLAHLEGGRSGRYLAHLLNILDHLGAELQIHWSGDPASQPGPMVSNDDAPNQPGTQAKEASADPTAQSTTESTTDTTGESTTESRVETTTESTVKSTTETTGESTGESTTESTVETTTEALPEAKTSLEESTSTQLTKITTLAMNVMAASQQLSGQPRPSR